MTVLSRGLQAYAVVFSFLSILVFVWGANRYLLGNTALETGWPVLLVVAAFLLVVGIARRRAASTPDSTHPSETFPWSSRGQGRDREE